MTSWRKKGEGEERKIEKGRSNEVGEKVGGGEEGVTDREIRGNMSDLVRP